MPDTGFTFRAFFRDSILSLARPWEYYPSMRRGKGIGEPLAAACIWGVITGIISFLWSVNGLGDIAGPLGKIIGGGFGILFFFGSLAGAVFILFAGGLAILVLSSLCGGSTEFEPSLRVSASLLVIMPLKALLGFITGAGQEWGSIISFLTSIYAVWMLYHALKHALGCGARRAGAAALILSSLPLLALMGGIICNRAVGDFTRDLKIIPPGAPGGTLKQLPGSGRDSSEELERLRKMMEEAQKNPKDQ